MTGWRSRITFDGFTYPAGMTSRDVWESLDAAEHLAPVAEQLARDRDWIARELGDVPMRDPHGEGVRNANGDCFIGAYRMGSSPPQSWGKW